MLTRRELSFALGAACLRPRAALAGECDNAIDDLRRRAAQMPLTAPSSVIAFSPDAGDPIERPLWSTLKGTAAGREYASILLAAYKAIKALDPHNPESLFYQGWLHYIQCCTDCNLHVHGHSGFLPWHRAYLYYFERLIQKKSGRRDFRLAVWDWEKDRAVPDLYNDPSLLPFVCANYSRDLNEVPEDVVKPAALAAWLQTGSMESLSFLGTAYRRGLSAGCAHGDVHTQIGGLLGFIDLAAFDPPFFGHHANVDRFWDHWCQLYKAQPGFFARQEFRAVDWVFYDALREKYVRVLPSNMFDAKALGYKYTPPTVPVFDHNSLNARPVAPTAVVFPEGALREFGKVLPRSGSFSLPAVAAFSAPHGARPGHYKISLRWRSKTVALGGFSLLNSHDAAGGFHACGGLNQSDLAAIVDAPKASIRVLCRPAITGLKVQSLAVQYPRDPDEWRKLPA